MGKIVDINDIEKLSQELKSSNKKIVFTNGCFDILHIGHAKYLNKSSTLGDILIVGLNSDNSIRRLKGESRPINKETDRAELLCELRSVDYVCVFHEDTPVNLIKKIKPDIYTKGSDYTLKTLPEAKCVIENGGHVEFINLIEGKSTTNIVNKIKQ